MAELRLSLKRVQTFIFEVPRLKAMLGANALVGQVVRHELPALLGDQGARLSWPEKISADYSADGRYPHDPLNDTADPDDPAELYERGILARDGGHFIVAFPDKPSAYNFLSRAARLLAELLPGVAYEARIDDIEIAPESTERHLLDLPVLQVCQETGQGPASYKGKKGEWEARSVTHRYDWGDRFRQQKQDKETRDIVGLMRAALYPEQNGKPPEEISDLVGGGYLALIHADGNGIGKRHNAWREQATEDDEIAREARGEAFFHSMRVAVRRAVVEAVKRTIAPQTGSRPYEILMLGGDDLLLACRADLALDFALNYARALDNHDLADGKPLDVAIGVAIAGGKYPLHRLQDLAESLASSAKRQARAHEMPGRSVIDWQVVTQSWFSDVADARRAHELIRYEADGETERLLLSGRPYFVLAEDAGEGLDTLSRARDKLVELKAPRSPLRRLRAACEQGRLAGEDALASLDETLRPILGWPDSQLWKPIGRSDENYFLTHALDVVDIWEIARLGSGTDG